MTKILPIILSGGFGTRLWPLSRQQMPKQFLSDIFGENTLFAKALKLVSNQDLFLPSIAVTHQDHKFSALQEYQSLNLKPESIILEPCSRNTAIAIIIACLQAIKIHKDEKINLLILPSDHLIAPQDLFEESVINATQVVNDNIVTFGIKPTFASTGYGYIQRGEAISQDCFKVNRFAEKPDEENANKFIKDGSYSWNSGIFLLQAGLYLKEVEKYLPEQLKIAKQAINNSNQKEEYFCEIKEEDYKNAQDISIDYAIMEKSAHIATTIMKADWSDVGDFDAIHKIKDKDKNNNTTYGNVELYDTTNSLIHSNKSLIACLGLNDIIAIETDDTILIANKNQAQNIKEITKDLLKKNKNEVKFHNRVFRPWGYYETLSNEDNFKVKRILVNPNSSLSLQMHEFRSEHWVVIKGDAIVQKEDKIFELKTGESTFIPLKTKHRLSNKTDNLLEIIEVQMGSVVSESDIIRFDDNYGRK